jgi:hypothetical protein
MILFCSWAQAAEFGAMVLTGSEIRSQSNGTEKELTYRNDYLGVRYQKMIFGLEYSKSSPNVQKSGSIEFSAVQEKSILSFKYLGDRIGFIQGLVGFGLGGYRDSSLIYFGNQSVNDQSRWSGLWTVDFGLNLFSFKSLPVWMGPQVRIIQFQNDNKGYYVAGMLHLGLFF